MDISPQNLMATDVRTLIIPQLNGRELVAASRVCQIWYEAITIWENLWEERLEQIKYCGKCTISENDYPKETSTYYEKWQLLIKNLFQKSHENRPLLSTPLPYSVIEDFIEPGNLRYFLVDRSFNRIKLIESEEEKEELREKREEAITKIHHAFRTDLSLYSCDVQDTSFIDRYITFEKKEEIKLQNTFLLAVAGFLKEGRPDAFFALEFNFYTYSKAVERLVLFSLEQGNCEQALGWIKRYIDFIGKGYGVGTELMERFGQQVIREQKSGLLEEFFLHLLSLNDPTFRQNESYQRRMKQRISHVLEELRDEGHGTIVDSLLKKLPLQ